MTGDDDSHWVLWAVGELEPATREEIAEAVPDDIDVSSHMENLINDGAIYQTDPSTNQYAIAWADAPESPPGERDDSLPQDR